MDDGMAGMFLGILLGLLMGGFILFFVGVINEQNSMLDRYNKQFCAAPCSPNPSGARLTDGKFECYCLVTVKP
jgi:hypothetical protein